MSTSTPAARLAYRAALRRDGRCRTCYQPNDRAPKINCSGCAELLSVRRKVWRVEDQLEFLGVQLGILTRQLRRLEAAKLARRKTRGTTRGANMLRAVTAALLFLALSVLPASAQGIPQGKALAWDEPATPWPTAPSRFEVSIDGAWFDAGLPPKSGATWEWPLPGLSAGSHTFMVRALIGTEYSAVSNAVAVAYDAPLPTCVASDLPSVFVTRWQHTTGQPGSKFRLDFQLASVTPIVEIQARIAGRTVATVTGSDLRETGGIWALTPASGNYQVTIWAKNTLGCTRESAALVNLVVK